MPSCRRIDIDVDMASLSRYAAGTELRPALMRNKDLLVRALKVLPVVGGK